jgi:CheY-like chemotaxis protein
MPETEPEPKLTTADGRPPRVAVVDGNRSSALITLVLVEQFGCIPFAVETGEAALALVRMEPPIDVVVMDLSVPDMDGIVAAMLIRAVGPAGAMPIVPLVRNPVDAVGPRGRAAGLAPPLVKPFSPAELYAALAAALARKAAAALQTGA